jgi:hypothetical protein
MGLSEGKNEQELMRPGVPGATLGADKRDEAIIKLADSFGELAREATQTLRAERRSHSSDYVNADDVRAAIHRLVEGSVITAAGAREIKESLGIE